MTIVALAESLFGQIFTSFNTTEHIWKHGDCTAVQQDRSSLPSSRHLGRASLMLRDNQNAFLRSILHTQATDHEHGKYHMHPLVAWQGIMVLDRTTQSKSRGITLPARPQSAPSDPARTHHSHKPALPGDSSCCLSKHCADCCFQIRPKLMPECDDSIISVDLTVQALQHLLNKRSNMRLACMSQHSLRLKLPDRCQPAFCPKA